MLICYPSYRRDILTQLNRGEGRHRLSRKCFHGQRGELRQSSVVLDIGTLSRLPAGSFIVLTASAFGSSTSCEVRGCFGLVNFGSATGKLGRTVANEIVATGRWAFSTARSSAPVCPPETIVSRQLERWSVGMPHFLQLNGDGTLLAPRISLDLSGASPHQGGLQFRRPDIDKK